ncbi:hypothetical protein ALQ33_00313 [Pseudomonas syringae pv. philadelphi]|uniref:Type II secretion system protein J n=1 Tax=Pseudomonas syringae pv. philadelphi TaxID=251706 RepID=A0A3M3Z2L5_9PSED|nr:MULTISPECIES: prepilin-type N-terminal cleavage/methylation domain-containing protein [Pseudomonas syringae group]RMO89000.1 hypothetical protein ALQ33_00313 [Pseudomonas syringae pv. philadelphi]SDX56186.1 general secretion pathway protein J [Pseudomonas syringae]SFM67042.1 general secretion pathway protein J [Pseudomonas syringae]
MSERQRGFTLLEVMVALVLLTFVSLIAWRGLDSITRTDRHLRESTEQTGLLLRALNQLDRDVALRAGVELQITPPGEEPSRQPDRLIPLSIRSTDSHHFRLDLIRSAANAGEGLQRIHWWLKDNSLYRAAAASSNRYPLPVPRDGIVVLDRITEIQVRVWNTYGGWKPVDDYRVKNPEGLEIIITRQTDRGPERYRTVLGPLD